MDPKDWPESLGTRTVAPPLPRGERYQMAGSNDFVIRSFLNSYLVYQPVEAGREYVQANSNNMRLDRGVLYSYAEPIARRVQNPDGAKAVLVTDRRFSTTTATKHLSPLVTGLTTGPWRDTRWWRVGDVTADTPEAHRRNVARREADCELYATRAARGARALREGKRQAALDRLLGGYAYGTFAGLSDLPGEDTPPGVLADWLAEFRPDLKHLAAAARLQCPYQSEVTS